MTDTNILQDNREHPFAKFVRILGKGKKGSRSLTEAEAFEAMSMILNGEAQDLQIGAFLMLLRVKEESKEEICGFVKAVQNYNPAPESIAVDLDWSSYAGKRRHLPWFLFSTFILAHAGYRVFMHGASGHTANRLYTENILTELNIPLANNWDDARTQLTERNFAYMPLRDISPKLANMINLRHVLGLRSPVHSFARLLNPLNASTVLQGVFHPPYSGLHQESGALLGYETVGVIKGEGGEIECNPDKILNAKYSIGGVLSEETWPPVFPRRHVKAENMSVDYMRSFWKTDVDDEYARASIISTAAFALRSLDMSLDQSTALQKAEALWNDRDRNFL
ncbi:MAG: anthranilate phosphoribosyltransferase [Pseudohongiellaceae bacterium]|jgi:anthranilate phosphoribosyltransferase